MSSVTVSRIGERVAAIQEADPHTPEAERLLRTADTLARVSHPCVVELLEVQAEPIVRLATGFVSTDSWADHPPRGPDLLARFSQLCSVLADLHESGIVHGSLQSRHVLVCSDGRTVICGFGDSAAATPETIAGDLDALADIAGELASAEPGRATAVLESVGRDLRRGRLSARSATLRLDRVDQRSAADGEGGASLRARLAGASARGGLRRRGRGSPPGVSGPPLGQGPAATDSGSGPLEPGRDALRRTDLSAAAADSGWRRRLIRVSPALAGLGGLAVLGLAVMVLTGDRGPGAGPDATLADGESGGTAGDDSNAAIAGSETATAAADGTSAGPSALSADGLSTAADWATTGVGDTSMGDTSMGDTSGAGSSSADGATGSARAGGLAGAGGDSDRGGIQPYAPELAAGTPEVEHNGRLYAVGRPGDLVLLGDWSCDGTATPAVLRPATGEVAVFARWPTAGSALRPALVEVVAGATDLAVDEATACDRLRIHTPDGSRLLNLEEP